MAIKIIAKEFFSMRKLPPLFFYCVFILLAGCVSANPGNSTADSYVPATPNSLSETRRQIIQKAAAYIGTPYRSPPNVPSTFDCSGYVSYVYGHFGHDLPKSTGAYGNVGTRIDWKDAQPGDILVFANAKGGSRVDHVALLWEKSKNGELAGSLLIHAASINTGASMLQGNPGTRTGVVITQLGLRGDGKIDNEYFYQRFMFCTRVLK